MGAQAPFTYSASLSYPPDIGAPNVSIPISLQDNFESENSFVFKLTGAGTQVVDFGTIAPDGAKLISVEVDPDASPAAQPINLQFNGGGAPGQVELAPGGFMTIGSPKPTAAGVLSMSIVHTTEVCVRVRILG